MKSLILFLQPYITLVAPKVYNNYNFKIVEIILQTF
jgi:hypothetical protein